MSNIYRNILLSKTYWIPDIFLHPEAAGLQKKFWDDNNNETVTFSKKHMPEVLEKLFRSKSEDQIFALQKKSRENILSRESRVYFL